MLPNLSTQTLNRPSINMSHSPLSPAPSDGFVSRYGNVDSAPPTPIDSGFGGPPYGASRPSRASPPSSQHPSSGTDMSRPSAASSTNRPPSSSSSMGMSTDGRSQFGGSKGPPSNRDSGKMIIRPEGEEALARHYEILREYLAASLRDEKGNFRPNKARDKLLRLSATQFIELSTDVFDELMRREDDRLQRVRNVPRFLLPRPNFHPKRNQARQKLSTLPLERFRQLATDVFYELERRIPRFAAGDFERPDSRASNASRGMRGPPPSGFRGPPPRAPISPNGSRANGSVDFGGRPLAKTPQSNTIVPNKSTMVEDDEDDEDGFNSSRASVAADKHKITAQAAEISELTERLEGVQTQLSERRELQAKVDDLESQLSGHYELQQKHHQTLQAHEELQRDLDEKVQHAQRLQEDMQQELEQMRRSREQDRLAMQELRAQASDPHTTAVQADQSAQITQLQEDLTNQERVMSQVRDEAMTYLREMRDLSRQNDQAAEQEEKLAARVAKKEQEVQEWRQRYARLKAQNRSLRASTIGLGHDNLLRKQGIMSEDGLVQDVDVTRYQMAVDDLLRVARQTETEAMLEGVKNVVVCVQSITSVVGTDGYPTPSESPRSAHHGGDHPRPASVSRLKAQVTGTANSLITATKQHAVAFGLSPVALLDAAASNLTSTVIELVKAVGIRPTSSTALADKDVEDTGDPAGLDMDGYYDDDDVDHEQGLYPSTSQEGDSPALLPSRAYHGLASKDVPVPPAPAPAPAPTSQSTDATSGNPATSRSNSTGTGWFGAWGKKATGETTADDYDEYR